MNVGLYEPRLYPSVVRKRQAIGVQCHKRAGTFGTKDQLDVILHRQIFRQAARKHHHIARTHPRAEIRHERAEQDLRQRLSAAVDLHRLVGIAQREVFPHRAVHLKDVKAQLVMLQKVGKLMTVFPARQRDTQIIHAEGVQNAGHVDALAPRFALFLFHMVDGVCVQPVRPQGHVDRGIERDSIYGSVHTLTPDAT